ncbi:MAG: hypothetical protein OEW79_09635 [Betaproteobacteria bacterium]|jgi:hypothetical protein|nr:hypothetical protein [Betaproteobacteria bacterium]MDH4293765.1 hypothetical protein [Betaproteobacteria bacterium]MDH5343076.1 hypothetical protein [Betaproteobacteria bacterium]
MNKIVAGLTTLLMALPAIANDEVVVATPRVDADPTGMILFALFFVGLIGIYAFVIMRSERKKKKDARK